MLNNLVSNAIKYGSDQPIQIRFGTQRQQACVQVIDHGIGIPEKFLDRIFDRFERITTQQHKNSLGLGLYICRQIVSAHGGSLSVESQLGKGSVFKFAVPLGE